ncbi:DUF4440 domain-containing protein [Algoriphagus sp. PAP.12]|uniref:DUF4440 domain-containing protein n=1 Tax=Algoriphagus sp. PAP.12 TaxID=2996678 RepID=UPI00227A683C|nr:DUF4440 domain-containing protein [Algoriphagus sp. PAP.12]
MNPIKSTFFLTILMSISFGAFSQNKSDEKAIQELIQNSFDHLFSNFDSGKLSDFYTEDFILLENGEVWDNEIIRGYFEKALQNENRPTRTNRFEFIETKVEGNRGWVAYHNFATISRNGEVIREIHWLESATAIKTPVGWRLDMLHSTRIVKE